MRPFRSTTPNEKAVAHCVRLKSKPLSLSEKCLEHLPSPKCLHDEGRLEKTLGEVRGRMIVSKSLMSSMLLPQVVGHQPVKKFAY